MIPGMGNNSFMPQGGGMGPQANSPGGQAANVIGGMYGSGGGGGGGGGGGFNYQRPGPGNNWGMGERPGQYPEHIQRLEKQCLGGDGAACNQLQVAQKSWSAHQQSWDDKYSKSYQRHYSPPRSVGSSSSGRRWG